MVRIGLLWSTTVIPADAGIHGAGQRRAKRNVGAGLKPAPTGIKGEDCAQNP